MDLPSRIPYNPVWWALIVRILLFGGGAAFMAYKAAHNTAGATVEGFTLGPEGATRFYWALCAVAVVFASTALASFLRRIVSPQYLEIGRDAFSLPFGQLQGKTAVIAYSEIRNISEFRWKRDRHLKITTREHRYTLDEDHFPDAKTYAAVRDRLISLHSSATASPAPDRR